MKGRARPTLADLLLILGLAVLAALVIWGVISCLF
jgi:hypothetical protein